MSLAVDRLINTVLCHASPTGRSWHLSMLQQEQQIRYGRSLGDEYAKRVLGESDKIIVIRSADFPFEAVGYEAKPIERVEPVYHPRHVTVFERNLWRICTAFLAVTCIFLQSCNSTL